MPGQKSASGNLAFTLAVSGLMTAFSALIALKVRSCFDRCGARRVARSLAYHRFQASEGGTHPVLQDRDLCTFRSASGLAVASPDVRSRQLDRIPGTGRLSCRRAHSKISDETHLEARGLPSAWPLKGRCRKLFRPRIPRNFTFLWLTCARHGRRIARPILTASNRTNIDGRIFNAQSDSVDRGSDSCEPRSCSGSKQHPRPRFEHRETG